MVNRPSCFLSFAIALGVLLLEEAGAGLSHAPAESPLPAASGRHLRTKRCSCTNWMDKECIYFCHLDIIWINTPSRATPYGLGNPQRRQKRSLGRCECSHAKDSICTTFCHGRPWDLKNPRLPAVAGLLAKLLQSRRTKPRQLNF